MTFWAKAQDAADCARILLAAGHADGAVNRAYYAMNFAAGSVLERVDPQTAAAKWHATLIGRFSQLVIRGQGVDPAIGRMLNLAFDVRLIADYEPEAIALDDANSIVADMTSFLAAIVHLTGGAPRSP